MTFIYIWNFLWKFTWRDNGEYHMHWCHKDLHSASNHWHRDCSLSRLFWLKTTKNHESPGYCPFVKGIQRSPAVSPDKGPATRKVFPYHDVITEWALSSVVPWCRDLRVFYISYGTFCLMRNTWVLWVPALMEYVLHAYLLHREVIWFVTHLILSTDLLFGFLVV